MKPVHNWTIRRSGVGVVVDGFDEAGPRRVTSGVKVAVLPSGAIKLYDHTGKIIADLSTEPLPVEPPQDGATR